MKFRMKTTPAMKVTLKRKPTEGHPKTGEYTVVKMSHSDAKKVCQEKYDKNKQPMEFLKCVAALRGNVKYRGYNPFGQAGQTPVKKSYKNASPQKVEDTSYATYASAWRYTVNYLNLQLLDDMEDNEYKEETVTSVTNELLAYMGTWNNGYMWATPGNCGSSYDWDNFWVVASGNSFSCTTWGDKISTGNTLTNDVLLNTGFYDTTPDWLYENFGVPAENIPQNRIVGLATICADAEVCPEVELEPDTEEEEEGGE